MKSIFIINPAIVEIRDVQSLKCASFIDFKVDVLLDNGALLCFILLLSLRARWAMFQVKNNIRSTPASSELTLVSYRSHNTHATNRHLCRKGERNGTQRRTKVSFSRTTTQALELLWLAKKDICQDEAMLNSAEIKAVATAIIKLRLPEGVNQSVSQSVSQSVIQKILLIRNSFFLNFIWTSSKGL